MLDHHIKGDGLLALGSGILGQNGFIGLVAGLLPDAGG
jgi:hypothetical protein